jgi:hypothetical protein
MNNLLLYAYESSICSAVLFVFYWVFLKNETYFQFNRFFLLGTVLFSCLIPLINFRPFEISSELSAIGTITGLGEVVSFEGNATTTESINPTKLYNSWQYVVVVFYLLGATLILIRILIGISQVNKLKVNGKRIDFEHYSVVYADKKLSPFSFFRTIFISDSLQDNIQKSYVINHELVHIRQLHTYDNIFIEIVLAFLWFNPFIWIIRRSLRSTHEYLADKGIKTTDANIIDYQYFLIQQISDNSPLSVSNSFNSMIQSRIKIMLRNKSTILARFKPLLILPLAFCLTLIFACSKGDDGLFGDNLNAGPMEGVLEIPDFRDLSPEIGNMWDSDLRQNYDVKVARVRYEYVDDDYTADGYRMEFNLIHNDSFKTDYFGIESDLNYDILNYRWEADTVFLKFEDSNSEEVKEFMWFPTVTGSALRTISTPE